MERFIYLAAVAAVIQLLIYRLFKNRFVLLILPLLFGAATLIVGVLSVDYWPEENTCMFHATAIWQAAVVLLDIFAPVMTGFILGLFISFCFECKKPEKTPKSTEHKYI